MNYSLHWYALRTKSRHEKMVRDRLAKEGLEPLLPTVRRLSQWKDRRSEIEIPLFPGYCFANFSQQDRLSVLRVPGIVDIVGGGYHPEPIPNEEIDALKAVMGSALPYEPHPYLSQGVVVEVMRGPLEGLRGILRREGRCSRVVIAVHLLQQAASVEINSSDLIPLPSYHNEPCVSG